MTGRKSYKPSRSHRSTLSLQKTEITINVYDLLPPGRLSSTLWFLGTSLLHSGVVINGKEYAYGGHDKRGVTGVYWTEPRTCPPGGTFRTDIIHGFSVAPSNEIDAIIRQASEEFLGTSYSLLTRNCNHFTSHLCQRLTGRPGPGWLNRAASIGVALPCMVPREWVEPPDFDAADGELLNNDDHADERSRMLLHGSGGQEEDEARTDHAYDSAQDSEGGRRSPRGRGKGRAMDNGKTTGRDSSGRSLSDAERIPNPI